MILPPKAICDRLMELYAQRKSPAEIAEITGGPIENIEMLIRHLYVEANLPAVSEAIARDVLLVDDAIRLVFPRIESGERGAVTDLIKLLEHRARLLGLISTNIKPDAVNTQFDVELQALVRQQAAINIQKQRYSQPSVQSPPSTDNYPPTTVQSPVER